MAHSLFSAKVKADNVLWCVFVQPLIRDNILFFLLVQPLIRDQKDYVFTTI